MQGIALSGVQAIESSIAFNHATLEKLGSVFNFVGPRGKQQAEFCSDCCGSNGNSCNPEQVAHRVGSRNAVALTFRSPPCGRPSHARSSASDC